MPDILVLLVQDGVVVVELIVALDQFVAIVGYVRGVHLLAGLPDSGGKLGQGADELHLLVVERCARRYRPAYLKALACGLAQHGADAGVGVLDEGARVTVEVDALGGVEEDVLTGVHLEQEILQRTHAHDAGRLSLVLLAQVGKLAQGVAGRAGLRHHLLDQIVGVHHRALAALHLAVGQVDHAVGEVHQALAPLESEAVEEDGEHLEVVVLLIAHHVDHLVDGEVLIAQLGRADVLRHIDRCAVGADEQLLVEAVVAQVGPHAAVLLAEEEALLQAFLHELLAHEICVALVVYLVKSHTEGAVGLVKSGVDPLVHLAPQRAHLLVALLPFDEHSVRLPDEGRFLLGLVLGRLGLHAFALVLSAELGYLLAIVLVKEHIVVAYEVVALLAGALGRLAVAPLLPGQHGLADMDAAIVDYVGLDHALAARLLDVGQRPAQQVVAHMAQMKRFVGVGGGILYHPERRGLVVGRHTVALRCVHVLQQGGPRRGGETDVQEAAHHIVSVYGVAVLLHIAAHLFRRVSGLLVREPQEREHHQRDGTLVVAACALQLYHAVLDIGPVEGLHSPGRSRSQYILYIHIICLFPDNDYAKVSILYGISCPGALYAI